MNPNDIVVCTNAKLSEGRLIEGYKYVVETVYCGEVTIEANKDIPGFHIQLVGCPAPTGGCDIGYWKSSRFRPLISQEVEDKIVQKITSR